MADMPVISPLETAKAVQKGRIKGAFGKAMQVGCTLKAGYVMDACPEDIASVTRQRDRLKETGTATSTVQLRDKQNQFHTVNLTDLTAITSELFDFSIALRQRKWDREAAIDACTTVGAVEAVVW